MARPGFIAPMLATLIDEPFDQEGWVFEPKWDGYRIIAAVQANQVRLWTRNQKDYSKKFKTITHALRQLSMSAVLDGEVIISTKGKVDFQALQNYERNQSALQYCVFDLLQLNGEDLRALPLLKRKALLKRLIANMPSITYTPHRPTYGKQFFQQIQKQGGEGIMAKLANGQYLSGQRSEQWLKIKTVQRQEVVVAGYTEPRGSRQWLGALVLGVYDDGQLRYVGHSGSGFNKDSLAKVYEHLQPLRQKNSPFEQSPRTNAPVQWLQPRWLAEVEFRGWTTAGEMRQPIFKGLRSDKPAKAVHVEQPKATESIVGLPASTTNPNKVYWPEAGYTKGQLMDYYRRMAEVILPYLKDRPQNLNRFPNGIDQPNFYQKHVGKQLPSWMDRITIPSNTGRKITYALCQNEEALLYLVNLGCIELNPWNARRQHLKKPDYMVFDLDPEAVPFTTVVEAAKHIHQLLDAIGLSNYCKTSGKTGLHIFVPLQAQYTFPIVQEMSKVIAQLVQQTIPEITSVERSPKSRQGKVYIDYLQNRIGQTLASAYSVRPTPQATVSTPLKWSEVTKRLRPERFTMLNIQKRLQRVGDLWEPVITESNDLRLAIIKLRKL